MSNLPDQAVRMLGQREADNEPRMIFFKGDTLMLQNQNHI